MNQEKFLQQIKREVLKEDNQASLILFGSRARGDNKPDSDWDILVLLNKKRDVKLENRLIDNIYEIELEHLQPISTLVLDKNEWENIAITPLYYNISKEGIYI